MNAMQSNMFRATRGYVTSQGDGDSDYVAFFGTLEEAIKYAESEVRTLRVTKRDSLTYVDDVMVEQLDEDGEPIGQPLFWHKA
jgi:hypothetical protein